jgi:tetratricopeptide (TPR) repeat protein
MNTVPCPHCYSPDTIWKPKAGKWECSACEERFDGKAPTERQAISPQRSPRASKPKRIFFSYGHDANRELVDRFKADLEARGHKVWIDYKEIGSWDDWKGSITRGIHDAQMAVAFLSVHSTRDPGVCRNEVAMALQYFGKVYPVLVEEIPRESIPVTIAHLQWSDLSRWQEFRDQEDLDFERFYEEKFLEIVSRVEGEAGRFASEAEVLRRALNPSGFEGRFARYLDGFTGREWVFDAYEHWLDQQPSSRVFWVKAGPGFGKTALAVQMANRHRAAIVGTWFCDHQSVELRDPLRALQTIAYQLALRWDDYRVRLLPRLGLFADSAPERIEEARKELAKKNLNDLFSFLISEPMAGLIWREHKLVILVDALDEATEPDGTNPLASLISGRFLELPEWIGFVVTSRPDASVVPYLQGFKPFAIEAGDDRNTADLQSYCSAQIGPMLPAPDRERLCNLLVEKSEGMMLFLRLVLEGLREGTLQPSGLDTLESGLPGLHSRYHAAFEARFRKDFQENVQPLLRLVMAAPGSMPLDLARKVLGWDRELAVRTRAMIGSYLVEEGSGLSLFHKTLGEWLASEGAGIYFTDPLPAGKALGEFLWERFDQRETDENDRARPLSWEKQVIDWLPKLLDLTDRREDWGKVEELCRWLITKYEWDISELLLRNAIPRVENTYGQDHSITLQYSDILATILGTFQENFSEAESLYRKVLKSREKVLGSEHLDTLESIEKLASLCRKKGEIFEAETMYRKILAVRENSLGLEHADTLEILNILGEMIFEKGDLIEAEVLYRRAHEQCKISLGKNHLNTLRSKRFLADFLRKKGDISEAEILFRQVLDKNEKVFGLEHPETLESIEKLGSFLYVYNDNFIESESLLIRAMAVAAKIYGSEDPSTNAIALDLSNLLKRKGNYEEAEILNRRVLNFNENAFGPDYSLTLLSSFTLGMLLADKGEIDESIFLHRRVMKSYEKTLILISDVALNNIVFLADLLKEKGEFSDAKDLYYKAFEERKKVLGPEHSDTLDSAIEFGNLLLEKGDIDEAENFYRLAYEGRKKILGHHHPDTLSIACVLGTLLMHKEDNDGAEHLYRYVLQEKEKALGLDHLEVLECAHDLGLVLEHKGDLEEAETLYRRSIAGYEISLGNEHQVTLQIVSNLGDLLGKKKEYDDAIILYRRALAGYQAFFGVDHLETLEIMHKFGTLMIYNGNFDEAVELLERAYSGRSNYYGSDHPITLSSLYFLAKAFYNKKDYHKSEINYNRVLLGYEKSLGVENSLTTSIANQVASICNKRGARSDALAVLRRFAVLSAASRDAVAYNLACYECLEGNLEESKRLISEHLQLHPEMKDQALADADFAAIHDWISELEV